MGTITNEQQSGTKSISEHTLETCVPQSGVGDLGENKRSLEQFVFFIVAWILCLFFSQSKTLQTPIAISQTRVAQKLEFRTQVYTSTKNESQGTNRRLHRTLE